MTIVAVAKLEGRQVYYCEACLLAYEDPALVCNCEVMPRPSELLTRNRPLGGWNCRDS